MPRDRGGSRAARGPAVVHCALSVGLVVLIAALGFTARQPPPPQIAELTPQAQHQITKAPTQLGSSIGSAEGGRGGHPVGTTIVQEPVPSEPRGPAAIPPTAPGLVHQCFGNPPRQISFDTQSPPCVSYWVGDNGGATSPGVTGTEIRVVLGDWNFSDQNKTRVVNDLKLFFNRTFELYGRQVNLIPMTALPSANQCSTEQAYADGLVEANRPFAFVDNSAGEFPCVSPEVAHDHVVATVALRSFLSQSEMAALAPYYWQYNMAMNDELAAVGTFVCRQLAGSAARYSPDPRIAASMRRFGLIFQAQDVPYVYDLAPLKNTLASCGVTLAQSEYWRGSSSEDAYSWETSAVIAMKNAGVTTVICYCAAANLDEDAIPSAADSQDYYPEWLLAWQNTLNADVRVQWQDASQRLALMGISFQPDHVPYPAATLNQALEAVDPGFSIDTNSIVYAYYQRVYWGLLLLFSGLQMAGPDLTPASFQRGLQDADFPNPLSAAMEGRAGFSGGSHAMTMDAAITWWSNTGTSPYPDEGAGTWCYAEAGKRFTLAAWPAGPIGLFQGPCISAPPGS